MKACTFFGHSDTPAEIFDELELVIIKIIEERNISIFYVGDKGNFDNMVIKVLKELKEVYTHIRYSIVLAYLPSIKNEFIDYDYENTIFPEILDKTPLRFAIYKRNLWMIKQSQIVITYVRFSTGGAATFKEIAEKQNKEVINIYKK